MKALSTTFLLLLTGSISMAQTFSGKTNAIKIDYKDQVNTVLPEIKWISPRYETSNSQDKQVNIEANVTSKIPLEKVILKVENPDNYTTEKSFDVEDKTFFKTITQSLTLDKGQYTLSIVAINEEGGEVMDKRILIIGLDAIASAVSMDRKDRALLFATDKYDYWNDLVNPVFDANSIADILKEEYGFEVEVIENPTQEEVFNKLADYSEKEYNPQDQLLIFFAGHGYFDDTFGEGFVVAKNSLENDRAKTTYISHNRLRSIINNIPSQHIFLTMDVCFGGTFDPVIAAGRGMNKTSLDSDDEFLARKLSYKTRKYLTSGGKTYVSDGIVGKHSPFARQFIMALKSGGGTDRILTISEIRPFVEKLVPEPRLGSFGDDENASDFVFVEKIKSN